MTTEDLHLARVGDVVRRREEERDEEAARPRGALLDLVAPGEDLDAVATASEDRARVAMWPTRIPRKFHAATVGDLEDELAGDIAGWTLADVPPNLVLTGAVGVGKTHAAIAAARCRWLMGEWVLYRRMVRLLVDLDWRNPDSYQHLDACCSADVLILDDLASERLSDWAAEKVLAIVDERWGAGAPTVVTSNLDPGDFEERVGARTYSRLADGAMAIHVGGVDRRRA